MKTRISLVALIVFVVLACGKDRFQTVPQLKLKSKSPSIVPVNGSLRLNVEFTDKEGDVTDSLLIVRQRLNVNGPLTLPVSDYSIPDFPHTDKGEFEISLTYQYGLVFNIPAICTFCGIPKVNETDTLRFKIVARDKAGNKSDTLVVDNIYVIR
jgi:hypothetical protein